MVHLCPNLTPRKPTAVTPNPSLVTEAIHFPWGLYLAKIFTGFSRNRRLALRSLREEYFCNDEVLLPSAWASFPLSLLAGDLFTTQLEKQWLENQVTLRCVHQQSEGGVLAEHPAVWATKTHVENTRKPPSSRASSASPD